MPFKPKIFVSSTLDLKNKRSKIDKIFKDSGAESLIYENNLTPSSENSIYRTEISNADFAIFIFDSKYGSVTDEGISGTHEEFNIALDTKIPFHIYIKKDSNKEDKLTDFLETTIKNNPYSFYYYNTDTTLLKKIKESIFVIANDISFFRIENNELSNKTINRISFQQDYRNALKIIKVIEFFSDKYENNSMIHYKVISEIFWVFNMMYENNELFIDRKLRDYFDELYRLNLEFTNLHSKKSSTARYGNSENVKIEELQFNIRRVDCFFEHTDWHDVEKKLLSILDNLFEKYSVFKEYVFTLKQKFEINGIV